MRIIATKMTRMLTVLLALSVSTFSSAYAADQLKLLSIEIPDKIGSLVVGKSNYADIVALLGAPELIENTVTETLKQEILDLKYPRKGLEFTIDKNKQMRVVRIEVYKPFIGSSVEGLRLGMPVAEAKRIISSRLGKPYTDYDSYVDWDIPNTLSHKYPNTLGLKCEDGIVIAIKMLGE